MIMANMSGLRECGKLLYNKAVQWTATVVPLSSFFQISRFQIWRMSVEPLAATDRQRSGWKNIWEKKCYLLLVEQELVGLMQRGLWLN